jgi:hypothetical protein
VTVDATSAGEAARVLKEFLRPFADAEVKLKPGKVSGNRCLALHYIDSRLVMDRLDETVGVDGWQDAYTVLPTGEVECRLSVRIAGAWVTKADVGGQSEQPDEGDRLKAAYSDALKRAAVKFGIGRFLYRMPNTWMDYDPVKKQVIRPEAGAAAPAVRDRVLRDINAATTRDRLTAVWRDYDAAAKAGRIPAADKPDLDAAFKAAAAKFPAPQPQPAKGA